MLSFTGQPSNRQPKLPVHPAPDEGGGRGQGLPGVLLCPRHRGRWKLVDLQYTGQGDLCENLRRSEVVPDHLTLTQSYLYSFMQCTFENSFYSSSNLKFILYSDDMSWVRKIVITSYFHGDVTNVVKVNAILLFTDLKVLVGLWMRKKWRFVLFRFIVSIFITYQFPHTPSLLRCLPLNITSIAHICRSF